MTTDFKRCGFTLIEMLTVIVIIGILAGLLMGVLQKARQRAWRLKAATETRDLVKAWQAYYMTYGQLPAGGDMTPAMVNKLQGTDLKIRFYEFPVSASSTGFKDPWGNLYHVSLSNPQMTNNWSYSTRVYLQNRRGYQYE